MGKTLRDGAIRSVIRREIFVVFIPFDGFHLVSPQKG